MCLFFEILFFITGMWIIFTGKLPEKLFNYLFGKGRYITTSTKARLLGLLLISPIPVDLTAGLLLIGVYGMHVYFNGYTFYLGIIYDISIVIITIIIARKIRQDEIISQ